MICLRIWKVDVLIVKRTTQFKRDFKRVVRRGKSVTKFRFVVNELASEQSLGRKYCDHILSGRYHCSRECHIEPDWLLIYTLSEKSLCLERTGSHSDLF
jgi:mRNA interferase YafQ